MKTFGYVNPKLLCVNAINAAVAKCKKSTPRVLLSSALSAIYLGFAVSLTLNAVSQGWSSVGAAMLFPVGFIMLILLGLDLATGSFAIHPMAVAHGVLSYKDMFVNWALVLFGNLIGGLLYAFMLYCAYTSFGDDDENFASFKTAIINGSTKKVIPYKNHGAAGWFAAFFLGILCNTLVTLGVMMNFTSLSTVGKIFAMYCPIFTFFAQRFEHSIVNFFLLPCGMMFGADFNFVEWWWWNQIPVILGNIVGGAFCTGLPIYYLYAPEETKSTEKIQVSSI